MKLFVLTCLTMVAFAANSILNRMALLTDTTDPLAFSMIRLGSGAVVLVLLVAFQGKASGLLTQGRLMSVLGLTIYMIGFSMAYVGMDAGTGALVLFGCVQFTMFFGAVLSGRAPKMLQWVGAGIAFGGLIFLLAPSASAPYFSRAMLMALAGIGWGLYSLLGQKSISPLESTAANFVMAVPLGIGAWVLSGMGSIGASGILLACLSGGATSALGYALWYLVLPHLQTSTAAIAQLSVPLIAAAAGGVLLQEPVSWRFVIAAGLVLGGIGVSIFTSRRV